MSEMPIWVVGLVAFVLIGTAILYLIATYREARMKKAEMERSIREREWRMKLKQERAQTLADAGLTTCYITFQDGRKDKLLVSREDKERFALTYDLTSKTLQIGSNVYRTDDIVSITWSEDQ